MLALWNLDMSNDNRLISLKAAPGVQGKKDD
jgi:hypothetical protein